MTPAPAASETEPGVTESSSAPSASERIRQKRGGLHGPEHPDVSEHVQTNVNSPDVAIGDAESPAPASSSGQSGPGEAPAQERLKRVDTDEEMRTGESDVKKPHVAAIGALTVCELAVREDGYDQSFAPAWDLIPRRSARCDAKCPDHGHRCQLREGHFKSCACRRCLMSHIGHLTADSADQEEEIMDVSGELHEHEQWEPEKIHCDYCSGEPLDEDLYQKGRDDELRAMQDYGVYVEIPIREAVGGKHIRGFPIAHMKGDRVRWRFVATEVNTGLREDNHQGTPSLMIVRATISRAGSCPTSAGVHMRMIRSWDVRKAFFNADLNEVIYVHPGANLCKAGHCW